MKEIVIKLLSNLNFKVMNTSFRFVEEISADTYVIFLECQDLCFIFALKSLTARLDSQEKLFSQPISS